MTAVLVVGVAVVDFVLSVEAFPTSASKYRADRGDVVGGGIAANAAVAIARLGGRPSLAARLGDDALGDLILAELVAEGVDTGLVHRAPGGSSSFSLVLVDATGERQIVNFRGARLTASTDWIAGAPRADAVLVDTRWPEGAVAALDLARRWRVPGVVDGEAPVAPALVQNASHLALSRAGLAALEPGADPAAALSRLAARVPGWVCVTDGGNGVWYTRGNADVAHMPAFRVTVADTLGAGDVWHGAFALALAEGRDEAAAVRFASAVAALKCTTFGGRRGTPGRAEVTRFLEENDTWN